MRLHAEQESLRSVLKCIASEEISPSKGNLEETPASDYLQYYLNEATRRIYKLNQTSERYFEPDRIGELARASLEKISPGQRDSLLQRLRILQIRPQVFRKVERFVNQITVQEQIMGDKYVVSQAGAVGPEAHAHDMTFNQIWNQVEEKSLYHV
jgi:hypothetical protein